MANANPFYNQIYGALYQEASSRGLPNADAIAHLGAAQAAQETGYGKSAPGNNYFGIKGPGQVLRTSESVNGELVPTRASFKQYGSMADSASGYLDFLSSNPRYRDVLNARTPQEAIALQGKTGYATDPNYGTALANIYRNNGNNMPPSSNGIMYQADPNQQPEYTPNPILKQNPDAGILERIANAPGVSEGLIQMGAGLLGASGSSNPLATGLSKGLTGFNQGYEEGIQNSKARAVPIAGGAFTQITDAKGNVTVVPNKDAQDFLLRQMGMRGQIARDNLQYKFDNQPLTAGEQRELKEIDQGIMTAEKSLKDTADIAATFNDPKINDVMRQAGGLPFGQAIMGALGMDEAKLNQRLEGLKVDAWLARSAALKGAISDAENARLNAPLPKLTDSADVWKSFIDQRTKDLQTMRDGLQRIRETDYRKRPTSGGSPEQPKAPPAANPVAPPAPVETQPLPPIGSGDNPDPLNLGLKKR